MRLARMIQAVDAHACGEPGRVIVGGVLDVPGHTMFEKMQHLQNHADGLRKLMLREPRGYPAANCNLILPPTHPDAAAGYVIMEQTEYPGMSGTNTICVTTVLLETGMVPMREPVTELTLESPAGLIRVQAECASGKVRKVTFRNVPAFAVHLDKPIDVPHLGTVTVDVAYGGMFYVISEAAPFGLRLVPEEGREIVRIGEMIKAAAQEQLPVEHPLQPGFTRGDDHGLVRAADPGRSACQERRRRVDRPARLESARHVDRGHRSLTLRHRHLRQDGHASRQGKAGPERRLSPRGNPGNDLHGPIAGRNVGRTVSRRRADDQRPGMDHRLLQLRSGGGRPFPGGIHRRRHLVISILIGGHP